MQISVLKIVSPKSVDYFWKWKMVNRDTDRYVIHIRWTFSDFIRGKCTDKFN